MTRFRKLDLSGSLKEEMVTMDYWSHQTIDVNPVRAGIGAAWNDEGIILGLSLAPLRKNAWSTLQSSLDLNKFEETSLPKDLADQLIKAIHGEAVEWTWHPDLQRGTIFQQQVWVELMRCPHGRTWSYSDLAKRLNKPRAIRAVGGACGRNPFPLRVPCHRIIAANGSLGGFTGDLELKRWLLQREAAENPVPDSCRGDSVLP